MVLGSQGPGRVGRRRSISAPSRPGSGLGLGLGVGAGATASKGTRAASASAARPAGRRARRPCAARAPDGGESRRSARAMCHGVPGSDGAACGSRQQRRRGTPSAALPGCARPRRPPSRCRSRPRPIGDRYGIPDRPAGTSEPGRGRRGRAAQTAMFSMNRTCVRKVCDPADGLRPGAHDDTFARPEVIREVALQSQERVSGPSAEAAMKVAPRAIVCSPRSGLGPRLGADCEVASGRAGPSGWGGL
jgi:hypothetical protein